MSPELSPPPESASPSPLAVTPGDTLSLKDQYDFALKHFLFVADTRLKIFNFYAILVAASLTATVTVGNTDHLKPGLFLLAGMLHTGLPIVFFIIELRNIQFLAIATRTLRTLESHSGFPQAARIFSQDDDATKTRLERAASYRTAFFLTYSAQLVLGLGIVYCALFVPHPDRRATALSTQCNPTATASVATTNPTAKPSKWDDEEAAASSVTPTSDTAKTKEEIFIMNRVIEKR